MGKAVLQVPAKEEAFYVGVGILQGLGRDFLDSIKGRAGLNKVNAAVGFHNLATDAMIESVAEGW